MTQSAEVLKQLRSLIGAVQALLVASTYPDSAIALGITDRRHVRLAVPVASYRLAFCGSPPAGSAL